VHFSLLPWRGSGGWSPELAFACGVRRDGQVLSLRYHLAGDLTLLALPEPVSSPARRDELWRTTCFEFFLAREGDDSYWEGNVSPAGHWNCYRFSGYRRDMREEIITPPVISQEREPRNLLLTVELALDSLAPPGTPCCLGLAAVLQCRTGALSHWALNHPAAQPDFHQRQGFIVLL